MSHLDVLIRSGSDGGACGDGLVDSSTSNQGSKHGMELRREWGEGLQPLQGVRPEVKPGRGLGRELADCGGVREWLWVTRKWGMDRKERSCHEVSEYIGLSRWLSGKESACQFRRQEFDPWVRKIPWRRK